MAVGHMDVDRWLHEGYLARQARVLLDGVDITARCRWFNDETGEAECFTTDPPTLDWNTREAVRERLHGHIEVVG